MEYPVTLMEREDSDHRVELVYHGPQARQQVTIQIYWHSGDFPDFAFAVHGDQALERSATRTSSASSPERAAEAVAGLGPAAIDADWVRPEAASRTSQVSESG